MAQVAWTHLNISDFHARHNYGLGLWQNHIERILAAWIGELAVPIYRGRGVTGFTQDETGVDVELSYSQSLRAKHLVGCDGGRSLIRKAAGIEFPGWDPTTSSLIAEVEMAEEPEWGIRCDALGVHALSKCMDEDAITKVVKAAAGFGPLRAAVITHIVPDWPGGRGPARMPDLDEVQHPLAKFAYVLGEAGPESRACAVRG